MCKNSSSGSFLLTLSSCLLPPISSLGAFIEMLPITVCTKLAATVSFAQFLAFAKSQSLGIMP